MSVIAMIGRAFCFERRRVQWLGARGWAGIGIALLTGCAQGPERVPLEVEVSEVLREQVVFRLHRDRRPEPPVLSRALLDSVQVPQLEIILESQDLRDYLVPQFTGSDPGGLPGRIEVWRTVDDSAFTFRDGMLSASRGMPEMLLSAAVPAQRDGRSGPGRAGSRSYRIASGDQGQVRLTLACDLVDLGRRDLEIVTHHYPVRHWQERCQGSDGHIVNDYWIDTRDGRLWQSRQWAGPETGYLRFRLVHLGLGAHKNVTLMRGS